MTMQTFRMQSTRLPFLGLLLCCSALASGAGLAAGRAQPADAPANIETSVVKVFSTMRYPDPFKPWTKQAPNEVSENAF